MNSITYTLNCGNIGFGNISCGKCGKTYTMKKNGFPPAYFMRHIDKCQHILAEEERNEFFHDIYDQLHPQLHPPKKILVAKPIVATSDDIELLEATSLIRNTDVYIQEFTNQNELIVMTEPKSKKSFANKICKLIRRNLFTASYRNLDEQK